MISISQLNLFKRSVYRKLTTEQPRFSTYNRWRTCRTAVGLSLIHILTFQRSDVHLSCRTISKSRDCASIVKSENTMERKKELASSDIVPQSDYIRQSARRLQPGSGPSLCFWSISTTVWEHDSRMNEGGCQDPCGSERIHAEDEEDRMVAHRWWSADATRMHTAVPYTEKNDSFDGHRILEIHSMTNR